MIKNTNILLLVLLIFLTYSAFAKEQQPEKVQVLHIIDFDYKNYPEERKFAYEYFWNKKGQYMPWLTLEHIGVAFYDINNNGQKELFAFVNGEDMCPRAGCPFVLFHKTDNQFAPLRWAGEVTVVSIYDSPRILSSMHNGYHDIAFGDRSKDPEIAIWQWNGEIYE